MLPPLQINHPPRTDPNDLFYGTSGPKNARIMIVGESWGVEEDRRRIPLVGSSGTDLTKILESLGIDRNDCFCTNVVAERPPGNDISKFFFANWEVKKGLAGQEYRGLYPRSNIFNGLSRLSRQIDVVKPDIVIGLGNYALWALTDSCFDVTNEEGKKVPTGIMKWRGSQLYTTGMRERRKFLPIIHPAAAMRQYFWRFLIKHDLRVRLAKALNDPGSWDGPVTNFIVRPSFHIVKATLDELIARVEAEPTKLATDIETRNLHIACIGFAWSKTDAICIPLMCVENKQGYWDETEEFEILKRIRKLLSHPNCIVIGQNFLYDAQYIYRDFLFRCDAQFDTMIAHHLCWPGTPKGLD